MMDYADGVRHGARTTVEANEEHDASSQWSHALEIYQDALAGSPQSRRALRGMADCYRQLEDYEAAIQTLTELIGLDLKHEELPELYVERSQNYLDYGLSDDAVRDLTKALHHKPEDAELFRKRAEAALQDRNIPLALADIQQSLQKEETFARLLTQAEILTYLRLFDRAQEVCQKAIILEPDNYRGPLELGRILRSAGNAPAALSHWETMLEKFPDKQHLVLDEMISCQEELGEAEAVIRLLKQRNAILPHDRSKLLLLAFCYQDVGDMPSARRAIEQAIQHAAENTQEEEKKWRATRIAQLYANAEMWEEAADEYALAIQKLDPTYSYAYLTAAQAMNKCGRYQQALTTCDDALRVDSTYSDVSLQVERTIALIGLGRTDEALNLVKQLTTPENDQDWLHSLTAKVHVARGNPELAIESLRNKSSWNLRSIPNREQLASLLEETGKEIPAYAEQWELIKLLQQYDGAITEKEAWHQWLSTFDDIVGPDASHYSF